MKGFFGLLVGTCLLLLIGSFFWVHKRQMRHAAAPIASASRPADHEEYAEERQARELVTVAGPLANYVTRKQSAQTGSQAPAKTQQAIETLQAVAYTPTAADHVGGSPVGTSRPILHQTFKILKAVDLPFEVPAHAASPQLRGTYHSFLPAAKTPQLEDDAEDSAVECLLLTDQQFTEFLHGRSTDAIFSADGSRDQAVNATMPPTLDQPAKYHLVFRNGARTKMFVQADFRVDF